MSHCSLIKNPNKDSQFVGILYFFDITQQYLILPRYLYLLFKHTSGVIPDYYILIDEDYNIINCKGAIPPQEASILAMGYLVDIKDDTAINKYLKTTLSRAAELKLTERQQSLDYYPLWYNTKPESGERTRIVHPMQNYAAPLPLNRGLLIFFNDDGTFLSNSSHDPFKISEIEFPTLEHFIQYVKYSISDQPIPENFFRESPADVKRRGETIPGFNKIEWDRISINILCLGIFAKFLQTPRLIRELYIIFQKFKIDEVGLNFVYFYLNNIDDNKFGLRSTETNDDGSNIHGKIYSLLVRILASTSFR